MYTDSPVSPLRTIIVTGLGIILGVLIIAYVLIQARLILIGPEITLTAEPETVHNERTVMLEGNARNISYLTLNGRHVYTDQNGYFKEAVTLENGYTVTTLVAADRYGRTTEIERQFVYVPASLSSTNN